MNRNYVKADIILVFVTVLAAAGWIFSRESLAGLPPLFFISLRFLLAGAVLAMISGRNLFRLSARQWQHSIFAGLVFTAAMTLWVLGLYHTSHVGEGAFITSMGIVLVPVFSRLFFAEKPARTTWIALPVAASGLACLSLNQAFSLESGQLFFLLAAVIFAFHFTIVSKLVVNIAPLSLTALQLSVVGVSTFCLSSFAESHPSQVADSIWWWFLASALIATSLRFWLQAKGQSFAPASHAVLILTLEPVWTATLAGLWFGEVMTTLQLTGCGLIFSSLIISRWRLIRAAIHNTRA